MQHYLRALSDACTTIFAFIVGLASTYWGGTTEALKAALLGALCVTIADTILGVVIALSLPNKHFSSHAFSKVFSKLLVYMCSLLAAYGVDIVSAQITGTESLIQLVIATMICFREISSMIEHSALLGVPWPEALQKKIDILQKQIEVCIVENNEIKDAAIKDKEIAETKLRNNEAETANNNNKVINNNSNDNDNKLI